jgi:hypothetical protein
MISAMKGIVKEFAASGKKNKFIKVPGFPSEDDYGSFRHLVEEQLGLRAGEKA